MRDVAITFHHGRPMGDRPSGLVLVAEDDEHIRELISEALTGAGLDVVGAADGEEAVRLTRARRPAAIVLDIGLPLLDGVAVAEQVRDLGGTIPIVVVTAGGRAGEVSRIRPFAEVTKPFDVADLVNAVVAAIAPPPGAGATDPATSAPEPGMPLPSEDLSQA